MAKPQSSWMRHPSWWIVVVAGTLVIVFSIAIIRELINGHTVRQQVKRLQDQVAVEQQRQRQLQDLIDYLGSPTFQEQEARLKLGLKKQGEQVIVVPGTNSPTNATTSDLNTSGNSSLTPLTHPQRWWQYFFGPHRSDPPHNA